MNSINTRIGTFNISMPPNTFQCKETPNVCYRENGSISIKSCLTKVVITMEDGTKEDIEPIVMESCMNPDIITITPIAYEEEKECMRISTPYRSIEFKMDELNKRIKSVVALDFEPMLKKHSCIPCRNCGRC